MPIDVSSVVVDEITIVAVDGARLAATLYRPVGAGPFAALLEALPYRKDDITASYADSYLRYVADGGFAVLRLDLRGTGSSAGILTDEYTDDERADLRSAIEWLSAQLWSSGRVGMFGTSYSGFNSLHMAADDIPQLGAVVAMYATDDRYTDDVHYCGGVLRALDLIDYPLYMVAMNALPPVPGRWGDDWLDEWRRRIDESPPWLLDWLAEPLDSDMWRRGSIRLGPGGAGYERITCPTMLIAGWADGYRNNTFRTIAQLQVPWRLLAGPWVHKDPATARPGPNVDADGEIIAFFHQYLRGGPRSSDHPGQVFVRRPVAAEPELSMHPGVWRELDMWPPAGLGVLELTPPPGATIDTVQAEGDVGMYAWNSCAGGLPWGQPLDQRLDNARSLTYDWPNPDVETEVLGNASVSMRVRSSAAVGHVSVKLCDVGPDGRSTLIARAMLDLTHVGCWPADPTGVVGGQPTPLVPGEWLDAVIPVEATTWTLVPGNTLRLAIAGTDWPNCWPPAREFFLDVERASVRLSLPVVDGLAESKHMFGPGPGPSDAEGDGVEWRYEHDVLGRETRVHSRYGGTYPGGDGQHITVEDRYEGSLGVSTVDLSQAWAKGRSRLQLTFPEGVCTTESELHVYSDAEAFYIELHLTAEHNGQPFADRTWTRRFER